MDILASFDTNVYNNKKAKIKSKDVEKLFTKKLKNFDFFTITFSCNKGRTYYQ